MKLTLAVVVVAGLCGCSIAPVPAEEGVVLDAGSSDAGFVCGPSTCNGCCDRNRCRRGNAEDECGNGGGQCAVCGVDALCGPSSSCEALDPNRYGAPPDGGSPTRQGNGAGEIRVQRCIYLTNGQICW